MKFLSIGRCGLSAIVLTTSCAVFAHEHADAIPSEARMTGAQLVACEIALQKFRARDLDPENFSIIVRRHNSETEVVFVPNQPPDEPLTLGGKTKYGPEIHYFVSSAGEVTRVSYAR